MINRSVLGYVEWIQCRKCYYLTPKYIIDYCQECKVKFKGIQFEISKFNEVNMGMALDLNKHTKKIGFTYDN